MTTTQKAVSIIMPVWFKDQYGYDMTVNAIKSIETTDYQDWELIIVDDCSPYDKFERLEELFSDNHTVIQTPENGGATYAFNYGLPYATGDFIQYQNNDTAFPHTDWLYEQMELFSDDMVGIVGSLLRYPSGSIQHAGACWSDMNTYNIEHIGRYEMNIQYVEDVPFITGCGMTVRREILEKNRGLTEYEGYGWDDIDIQVKAKQDGWIVKVAPNSQFVHIESYSYKDLKEKISSENYKRNREKFEYLPIHYEETLQYFKDEYYN